MAENIIEIANREVFCLRPEQPAQEALDELQRLGIHGAPVVDRDGAPLGVVTMTDLVGDLRSATVGVRMSQPADVVPAHAPIRQVARTLIEHGRHHTVVVDHGRVIGFVSSVDLLAAVLGAAPPRRKSFAHQADQFGLRWSDPLEFEMGRLDDVPPRGGFLALIHGGAFRRERVVFIEAVDGLRERVEKLLSGDSLPPELETWSGWGSLQFAWAEHSGDIAQREEILGRLQNWRGSGDARVHDLLGHRQMCG